MSNAKNKEYIVAKKSDDAMPVMTDLNLHDIKIDKSGYGIAVDIGTTTVAAFLFDLKNADILAVESRINDQRDYGPDVITRIKYVGDHVDGLEKLHNSIIKTLNDMFAELCNAAEISLDDIEHAVITGNTTMLHLLRNLSPVSMGTLPFEPLSYFGEFLPAKDLSLNISSASLYLPYCITSFVGADIVCAVVASEAMKEVDGHFILMDIGTNGEVMLGDSKEIVASSTAAGPAFEGWHIKCGMAGISGAIDSLKMVDGNLQYTTINNTAAVGLCGSGLLDAIALFVSEGYIDNTGRILSDNNPFYFEYDEAAALRITDDIFLTQKDLREFQIAKAAIAAGWKTLMHDAALEEKDIEKLYIAGGFGNFMDIDSARTVGLIPSNIEAVSIGNGAAAGAAMLLLNNEFIETSEQIKNISKHVQLGHNPHFMDEYVNSMLFE